MRRPAALLLPLLVLVVAAPAPAAAKSYKIDVPKTLAKRIAKAKAKTDTPILLPSRYTSERKKLYGSGGAISGGGYSFSLSPVKGCNGGGACTFAEFYGREGAEPDFEKKVGLARGITGYFQRSTCGANCSNPEIQWVDDGVLYGMSAAMGQRGEKRRMVKLANSAIRNGPR